MIKRLKTYLRDLLIYVISNTVPKEGKRIIFLTLCYSAWCENKDSASLKYELEELNRKYRLTKDKNAFEFIIAIQPLLKELDGFDKPKRMQGGLPEMKVYGIPEWLKYDDLNNIYKDLKSLRSYFDQTVSGVVA